MGPGPNERPFTPLVDERPQRTAINFWGERPRTFEVNGLELLAAHPRSWWPFTQKVRGRSPQKLMVVRFLRSPTKGLNGQSIGRSFDPGPGDEPGLFVEL